MKNKYTEQDINLFFERFKQLPEYFELEEVHQLIDNPHAKATHTVHINYKQLKFIIMTIAFIIGLSTLIWLTPNKTNENKSFVEKNSIIKEFHNAQPEILSKSNKTFINSQKNINYVNLIGKNKANQDGTDISNAKSGTYGLSNNGIQNTVVLNKDCAYPLDTVINKNSLHIYLTNDELVKLGVHIVDRSGKAFYYYSVEGKNSSSQCWNVPCRSDTMVPSPFYIAALTDTMCTTERWGAAFYQNVDTLVPVLPKEFTNKNMIFWFLPSDSIFKVLPERYRHLANTFKNLKCLKKANPERNIVNHWEIKRNVILDKINYLELNKSELTAIGINFTTDGFIMTDPTKTFYYRHDKWGTEKSTLKSDSMIDFPNLFPTLITDIKGLEQHRYGLKVTRNRIRNSKENLDLLIPVLMPLSKYISNRDYELVFWYYPTKDFLNALPERIKGQLNAELKSIVNDEKSNGTSCTYFEVCKSTLLVDDLKIYPNPANYTATIEFNNSQVITGTVSIVSIAGVKLKELMSKSVFIIGHNSYQLDLSGITPGMYLISINTDKGFKTQRLIISR